MEPTVFLRYAELRGSQGSAALRQLGLPLEYALSLPLPSLRWNRPAYAAFASPALRLPGQPKKQGPPAYWWVVEAVKGQVLLFAAWETLPYAPGVTWEPAILPPLNDSLSAVKARLATLEALLDELAPAFFQATAAPLALRHQAHELLRQQVPAPLMPQYQALTPDFWAWLTASAV